MLQKGLSVIKGNILVFTFTDTLGNFARSLVFPYVSLYILALGGNAARIGWVSFLSLSISLFMLPLAGFITDRSDRVRLLVLSGFLSSIFLGIIMIAPNWQVVAIANMLFGTVVFQFPAYASLIADSLSPAERGHGMGMMGVLSSSLAIAAPFIAGLIIENYTANLGIRILYAAMLAITLISAFIQHKYLREKSIGPRETLKLNTLLGALGKAYRMVPQLIQQMSPTLKFLALIILLNFLGNVVTGPFWVVYAIEQVGFSAYTWGVILLVEGIVRVAAFIPAGWLIDHLGRTRVILGALLVSAVTIPLFIVLKSFTGILIIRLFTAVAFSLALPACMALMADLVPRNSRGQMMAAIGQGGMMIAPTSGVGGPSLGYLFIPLVMLGSLAGGYLYTFSPSSPWYFSLATTLISIVLLIAFVRDPKTAEV
jgi:MFS family permease